MAVARDAPGQVVPVGRVVGAHGIRGQLRIRSDTEPRQAIFGYQPWLVGAERSEMRVVDWAAGGKWLLVTLDGIEDRTAAQALAGEEIAVRREELPELPPQQYYWVDLLGSEVTTVDGVALGTVQGMLETGAHDVMRVQGERERLIPFVLGRYVRSVDTAVKRIEVDWDPDF